MAKHRSQTPTGNAEVPRYVFTEKNDEYQGWVDRYMELLVKAQSGDAIKATMTPAEKRAFKGVLSTFEKAEMKAIREKIIDYKKAQGTEPQSVLNHSESQKYRGSGKDNMVYQAGRGKYVTKYSAREESGTPETVEYLRKKYQILKKYMGDYIPSSKFVLGQVRVPMVKGKIDQRILNNGDSRDVAVTIQREVQGRDFSQMSAAEKRNPKLLACLEEGFRRYWEMKDQLEAASKALDKPADTMDVTLELGGLSTEPDGDRFDREKAINFDSPNVMWDAEKERIYFIDFDMSEWNQDKEEIYQTMMAA